MHEIFRLYMFNRMILSLFYKNINKYLCLPIIPFLCSTHDPRHGNKKTPRNLCFGVFCLFFILLPAGLPALELPLRVPRLAVVLPEPPALLPAVRDSRT